jgi:hypothetical protein
MPLEPERRQAAPDRRQKTRGGRRALDIPLRSPDYCPTHGRASTVIETIPHNGFIERTHKCKVCHRRWPSFQTIIDPTKIRYRESI